MRQQLNQDFCGDKDWNFRKTPCSLGWQVDPLAAVRQDVIEKLDAGALKVEDVVHPDSGEVIGRRVDYDMLYKVAVCAVFSLTLETRFCQERPLSAQCMCTRT